MQVSLVVLAIAIFLRFWQVPARFIFDIDVQYQVLYALTIVKDFHIVWIGVSASNTGYYLGPGLVYLTSFLLWISRNPVVLGYFASLVGSLTLLSIWFVAKKIFGEKVSLIATVLYGCVPFIINYDRRFWPIFVPLVATWMLYGLIRSQHNKWWLLLCVFLIGISFHIHLSLMLFWPFVIYAFMRSGVFRLKRSNMIILALSVLMYFALTSPLLVFDLVHNFDNIKAPFRMLEQLGKGGTRVPRAFPWTMLALLAGSTVLFIKQKSVQAKWLLGILSVMLFALIVYPGPMQEYYLVLVFPYLAMGTGVAVSKESNTIVVMVLAVIILVGSYSFLVQPNTRGLAVKKASAEKVCPQTADKPDYLEVGRGGRDYEGWYYLFSVYCKQPARSDVDSMFGWLYQDYLNTSPPMEQLTKIQLKY